MPDEPKFNQKQYDLLMKCSKKKDMTEWNQFVDSTDHKISLKDAHLKWTNLKGANLKGAKLKGAILEGAILEKANLQGAELQGAILREAILREAYFQRAILQEAKLQHADLQGADLQRANLQGAILWEANLQGTNLQKADLREASLHQAILWGAKLQHTDLQGAKLQRADLQRANLREAILLEANLSGANLLWANFQGANLSKVDLRTATLIGADLSESNITGTNLYGTSRDDWIIDGIKCDYIYWDQLGKERTPKDRIFQPGEFEELYKSLPTITYYFNDEFNPITPLIMDKVVASIDQKHKNFELKLDSFHSRGTPHAVFTVLHKDYTDEALNEIKQGYEKIVQRLEGKLEAYQEAFSKALETPNMRIEHMGNTFGNINSGRDTNIATDDATLRVNNIKNDIESLTNELMKLNVPQPDINSLKSAIVSDKNAPEHKDKSFGKNVAQWFSNMSMRAGSAAWRIGEQTTAGVTAGLLLNALKAYYGWT